MPVDTSLVGRVYPPTAPYTVSREKIAEFADAIGDPNPAYRSVEAAAELGYADVVAPPTFPIVFTLPAGNQMLQDPASGVDFSRLVHGDQRFVHTRPLLAGDTVRVEVTVDAVKTVAGNEMITLRAEARTLEGELVVTATTLTVVRGES